MIYDEHIHRNMFKRHNCIIDCDILAEANRIPLNELHFIMMGNTMENSSLNTLISTKSVNNTSCYEAL